MSDEFKPSSQAVLDALERLAKEYPPRKKHVAASTPENPVRMKFRLVWDLRGDEPRRILTCLDERYVLWRDFLNHERWRWALRVWPDDSKGVANHGAGTFHECARKCLLHFKENNPGEPIPE